MQRFCHFHFIVFESFQTHSVTTHSHSRVYVYSKCLLIQSTFFEFSSTQHRLSRRFVSASGFKSRWIEASLRPSVSSVGGFEAKCGSCKSPEGESSPKNDNSVTICSPCCGLRVEGEYMMTAFPFLGEMFL